MLEKKIITFSFKRKILLLSIKVLFIFAGVYFLYYVNSFDPFWNKINAWLLRLVGIVTLAYFGTLTFLDRKVTFRKIALIIDDDGIVDQSSFWGTGRIAWSEIDEIRTSQSGSVSYVLIFVKNPSGILTRSKNWFIRWHLKSLQSAYRTPVAIPLISLNIYIDDLGRLMLASFEEWKRLAQG